jgi:hypothetical protein
MQIQRLFTCMHLTDDSMMLIKMTSQHCIQIHAVLLFAHEYIISSHTYATDLKVYGVTTTTHLYSKKKIHIRERQVIILHTYKLHVSYMIPPSLTQMCYDYSLSCHCCILIKKHQQHAQRAIKAT